MQDYQSEFNAYVQADRAQQDAMQDYQKLTEQDLEQNIARIMQRHRRRMKRLDIQGFQFAIKLFPALILALCIIGWLAWRAQELAECIVNFSGAALFFILLCVASIRAWLARKDA